MEYERPKGFYGVVVKTQNAVYAGKKGTLVWDYIIWNEISFVEDNTNKSESLFKSLSDSETEAKFAELSRVYGVKERTGAKNDNVEKKTEEDHKPGSLISRAEDFLNGKMNKKENREEKCRRGKSALSEEQVFLNTSIIEKVKTKIEKI